MSFENTDLYKKHVVLLLEKIVTSKIKIDLKNKTAENLQVQCPVYECDYEFKGNYEGIMAESTKHYDKYHGSRHDTTKVDFTSTNKKNINEN